METGICVNSRSRGGAIVYREGTSRVKHVSKIALAAFLAVSLFAAAAGTASAALPAPNWMPGSPIMAGTQVILLWMPVNNAVKYNIYVNGKKTAESMAIQYMMASPEASGEYNVEIAAVDASGTEGAKSRPGTFKIITVEPPANIFSRVTEGRVSLRWDTVKGAVIYNVYRAEKEGGESKLLTSVQSEGYTDTGLQVGKKYFYTIVTKDLAGKESPRSKVHRVEIPRPAEKEKEAEKVVMKILPSREIISSRFKDNQKIKLFQGMTVGPDGFLYIGDASRNEIVKVDRNSMEVVKSIGCGKEPEGQCKAGTFVNVAVSSSGLLYVVDYRLKKILSFDSEGKFRSEFGVPDPAQKEVLAAVPEAQKAKGVGLGGVAVDDKRGMIYVSDENFNTIHKFTLDGKSLGCMGHSGNTEKDLLGPAGLALNPTGELLYISQPLTHIIQVMDTKTGEVVRTVGRKHNQYIGGFIGINGMTFDAAGNLYVADSGVHTIQYFDGKTGNYIAHVGDESGKPDEDQKNRASLDGIQLPVGVTAVGKNQICFFRGDKNQITCREMVGK